MLFQVDYADAELGTPLNFPAIDFVILTSYRLLTRSTYKVTNKFYGLKSSGPNSSSPGGHCTVYSTFGNGHC